MSDNTSGAGEGVQADGRGGAQAGVHLYGYAREEDDCVLKRPGCHDRTIIRCHDLPVCSSCLHPHKAELERDGIEMKFEGHFDDEPQALGVEEAPAQDTGEIHNPTVLPAWTDTVVHTDSGVDDDRS